MINETLQKMMVEKGKQLQKKMAQLAMKEAN